LGRSLVSHIGIAVADLAEAVERYTRILGTGPDLVTAVADQKVKVAVFASPDGADAGGRIELVAPDGADSPVRKFLDRRGEGMHHVCVYVEDIEARLRELKEAGYRLIDEEPRIGAEGNRIAFVHPSSADGVLIELEERKSAGG
jgi:methylmalonyl-CoA/ethylmalonyl-CoA epimerase